MNVNKGDTWWSKEDLAEKKLLLTVSLACFVTFIICHMEHLESSIYEHELARMKHNISPILLISCPLSRATNVLRCMSLRCMSEIINVSRIFLPDTSGVVIYARFNHLQMSHVKR